MSRTRLTVRIDMIAPISNDEYPLPSNKGEVVFSNNSYIEVYEIMNLITNLIAVIASLYLTLSTVKKRHSDRFLYS
ncbi:hypothetical protein [Ursidibacter sp. B-7004-1]